MKYQWYLNRTEQEGQANANVSFDSNYTSDLTKHILLFDPKPLNESLSFHHSK